MLAPHRRAIPHASVLLLLAALSAAVCFAQADRTVGRTSDSTGVTASNWTLTPVGSLTSVGEFPLGCLLSPDGRWLVTGSLDGTARVWDLTAKDVTKSSIVLRQNDGNIACAAISSDSRWLVTGGWDCVVRLWDLKAKNPGAAQVILVRHDAEIEHVAISPDGRLLAACAGDGRTHLWHLSATAPPTLCAVLETGQQPIAFTPDGHWLVCGSTLWNLRMGELIDFARRAAGRELSSEERATYQLDSPEEVSSPQPPGP